MKGFRYTAVVDGEVVWESNSIPRVKEKADHVLEYRNGYFAVIRCGNKIYATRFFDEPWRRHG